ncbi:hypothetical protein F5B21DRAFT_457041 [Xylaria acuta]|nr:hypothetical protein F5B21DRAFT_457041 [Xylaria acuta]
MSAFSFQIGLAGKERSKRNRHPQYDSPTLQPIPRRTGHIAGSKYYFSIWYDAAMSSLLLSSLLRYFPSSFRAVFCFLSFLKFLYSFVLPSILLRRPGCYKGLRSRA